MFTARRGHSGLEVGLGQLLKLTGILDVSESTVLCDQIIRSPMLCGETSYENQNHLDYQIDRKRRDVNIAVLDASVAVTIENKIKQLKPVLESYYGIQLSGYESPQCLYYKPGQFYSPHRDSHPDDERSRYRCITVVIFLSNSGSNEVFEPDFVGGGLRVYPYDTYFDVEERRGNGVAFPSGMLHEVKPIQEGARYSIATWFYGSKC